MKQKIFSIVLAVGVLHLPGVLHAQAGSAAQASPWFGRIAALGAFYHSSATIATTDNYLPAPRQRSATTKPLPSTSATTSPGTCLRC
jgi:hypothetical protein